MPIGGLGDGEAIWHADMTYVERPPMAAILYAIEIPPAGGDTYWANMVLAPRNAARGLKRASRVARPCTTRRTTAPASCARATRRSPIRTAPGARHPLVRTHPETGRRSLFLGRRRNSYIVGLELGESERLLDELWRHATQPQFTLRQQWRVGDVMVWDNRCTLHRRDASIRGAPAPAPHADQGFLVTIRRSSSRCARGSPQSRRPRREAERTCIAAPSKKNSTSSTNPR